MERVQTLISMVMVIIRQKKRITIWMERLHQNAQNIEITSMSV